MWFKQLADGGRAVALLNRGEKPATITVDWLDISCPSVLPASVRDLWAKKHLGRKVGSYSAEVPSDGVVLVTVNP